MREDLKLAAYAVALGYSLNIEREHRGAFGPDRFDPTGIPHDGLQFEREDVHVWQTARGWRVAKLTGGRFPAVESTDFHRTLLSALKAGAGVR